jgi:hypothetical protein
MTTQQFKRTKKQILRANLWKMSTLKSIAQQSHSRIIYDRLLKSGDSSDKQRSKASNAVLLS